MDHIDYVSEYSKMLDLLNQTNKISSISFDTPRFNVIDMIHNFNKFTNYDFSLFINNTDINRFNTFNNDKWFINNISINTTDTLGLIYLDIFIDIHSKKSKLNMKLKTSTNLTKYITTIKVEQKINYHYKHLDLLIFKSKIKSVFPDIN